MEKAIYCSIILLSFAASCRIIYALVEDVDGKELKRFFPILFISATFGAFAYTAIVTAIQGNVQFGLSSLGAAIGMFLCTGIYPKVRHIKSFKNTLRIMTYCLPLIYALSKFGCLINGCCCGEIADIPIQIIESAIFLTIFFIVSLTEIPTTATVMLCAIAKIFVENYRDGMAFPNANQIVCIGIILCNIAWIAVNIIKRRKLKNATNDTDRSVSIG